MTIDLSNFNLDDPELDPKIAENAMRSGNYPYDKKMKWDDYEDELEHLQVELIKALNWLDAAQRRMVVLFEGRDAAGKGGTIRVFRQHLSPRKAHIIALGKPSDRERGQWYFQRYVPHLPSHGEMSLFDRSWYNRGVVEPVMGFCTPDETRTFLKNVPKFEQLLINDGIFFFKVWLNIGREMQLKRFHDRRHDPLKQWKISPVDLKAIARWEDFTEARDEMIRRTHSKTAPWTIARANDKRRLRLNIIRHILLHLPYKGRDKKVVGKVDEAIIGQGPNFLKSGD